MVRGVVFTVLNQLITGWSTLWSEDTSHGQDTVGQWWVILPSNIVCLPNSTNVVRPRTCVPFQDIKGVVLYKFDQSSIANIGLDIGIAYS